MRDRNRDLPSSLGLLPDSAVHQDSRSLWSRLQFITMKDIRQRQERGEPCGVNSGNPHTHFQESSPVESLQDTLNSFRSVLGQRELGKLRDLHNLLLS